MVQRWGTLQSLLLRMQADGKNFVEHLPYSVPFSRISSRQAMASRPSSECHLGRVDAKRRLADTKPLRTRHPPPGTNRESQARLLRKVRNIQNTPLSTRLRIDSRLPRRRATLRAAHRTRQPHSCTTTPDTIFSGPRKSPPMRTCSSLEHLART